MQNELLTLAIFIVISSITPGPNNLMLLHGSLHRGFRACYGHLLGISTGLIVMAFFSYWGMAALVIQQPTLILLLKTTGTFYLLWLGWVMWREGIIPEHMTLAPNQHSGWTLPLNFWQAAIFQWANPKAWLMVVMMPSLALLVGNSPLVDNAPLYPLIFILNLACISLWAAGGNALRRLLHHKKTMQTLHTVIVLATLYCAVTIWV